MSMPGDLCATSSLLAVANPGCGGVTLRGAAARALGSAGSPGSSPGHPLPQSPPCLSPGPRALSLACCCGRSLGMEPAPTPPGWVRGKQPMCAALWLWESLRILQSQRGRSAYWSSVPTRRDRDGRMRAIHSEIAGLYRTPPFPTVLPIPPPSLPLFPLSLSAQLGLSLARYAARFQEGCFVCAKCFFI